MPALRFDQHLMKTQHGFARATIDGLLGGPDRATATSEAAIDDGPPAREHPRGALREIK
jgi:hypothetical protein